MANLASLLRAYDLDPGDVVYVDSGVYVLPVNVVIDGEDSGVTIQGATGEGHESLPGSGELQ